MMNLQIIKAKELNLEAEILKKEYKIRLHQKYQCAEFVWGKIMTKKIL
jgi:hypothetical protein